MPFTVLLAKVKIPRLSILALLVAALLLMVLLITCSRPKL